MKNRTMRYCILFLLVFLISLSAPQMKAIGQEAPGERMDRAVFAEKRINRLQQAARTLQELAVEPLPANLSADGKTEAANYTRWLRDAGRKLDDLAKRWQDDLKNRGMVQSVVLSQKKLEEMNMSYSQRYSALRDQLLDELGQYASIAQFMQRNYDSAQGSISNLR